MKVFVLEYEHRYEYTCICGVFSTEQKAREAMNCRFPGTYQIYETEIDVPMYRVDQEGRDDPDV